VSGGRTYVVGERGPELFTVPTSGTIIPSHRIVRPDLGSAAAIGAVAGGASQGPAPQVTVNPQTDVTFLMGDADVRNMLTRPGVSRVIVEMIEREGFRRG
jgi:hypothetical protein